MTPPVTVKFSCMCHPAQWPRSARPTIPKPHGPAQASHSPGSPSLTLSPDSPAPTATCEGHPGHCSLALGAWSHIPLPPPPSPILWGQLLCPAPPAALPGVPYKPSDLPIHPSGDRQTHTHCTLTVHTHSTTPLWQPGWPRSVPHYGPMRLFTHTAGDGYRVINNERENRLFPSAASIYVTRVTVDSQTSFRSCLQEIVYFFRTVAGGVGQRLGFGVLALGPWELWDLALVSSLPDTQGQTLGFSHCSGLEGSGVSGSLPAGLETSQTDGPVWRARQLEARPPLEDAQDGASWVARTCYRGGCKEDRCAK